MPNQAGRERDLPVRGAESVHAPERHGDLSQPVVWRPSPECPACEDGASLTMWGIVLVVAALAWWVALAWAITKWG